MQENLGAVLKRADGVRGVEKQACFILSSLPAPRSWRPLPSRSWRPLPPSSWRLLPPKLLETPASPLLETPAPPLLETAPLLLETPAPPSSWRPLPPRQPSLCRAHSRPPGIHCSNSTEGAGRVPRRGSRSGALGVGCTGCVPPPRARLRGGHFPVASAGCKIVSTEGNGSHKKGGGSRVGRVACGHCPEADRPPTGSPQGGWGCGHPGCH